MRYARITVCVSCGVDKRDGEKEFCRSGVIKRHQWIEKSLALGNAYIECSCRMDGVEPCRMHGGA